MTIIKVNDINSFATLFKKNPKKMIAYAKAEIKEWQKLITILEKK
jgi:hypothetical protein